MCVCTFLTPIRICDSSMLNCRLSVAILANKCTTVLFAKLSLPIENRNGKHVQGCSDAKNAKKAAFGSDF